MDRLGWSLLLVVAVPLPALATDGHPPWQGREQWVESAMLGGRVVEKARLGRGVTNPWKVTLEHQGERLSAIWKPLPESSESGFHESYRAEAAAYRLSRFLGLDMVPPTVVRRLDGEAGSLQLWVECYRQLTEVGEGEHPPAISWSEQWARMRFFDALIANPDRNAGNVLVCDEWQIVLIDHSRALSLERRRAAPSELPNRFDRRLLDGARTLDMEQLEPLLGDLYLKAELKTLLRQRDRLVAAADRTVEQYGEAALFGQSEDLKLANIRIQ